MDTQERRENIQYKLDQLEGGYKEDFKGEEGHVKIKSSYVTLQGWQPPARIPPIPGEANLYIIKAPTDTNRNNG